MDFKIEAFTRAITGNVYYVLIVSSPYEYFGEALWEYTDEEDIKDLIIKVQRTIEGEWDEPLPFEFGNDVVGVWVHQETCVARYGGENEVVIPTLKVLHLLNLWLSFIRFSK